MPAKPAVGLRYRQEHDVGQAEDRGEIFARAEQAEAPAGHLRRVLVTKDRNALKPRTPEYTFYARGVGPVLALGISGGADRAELISFRRGR